MELLYTFHENKLVNSVLRTAGDMWRFKYAPAVPVLGMHMKK